jgi:ABC-2 type transport system ATP-binding protein
MVDPSTTADGRATPLLEVAGLTKRFGSLTAVSDVSFSVREGEILGLIGPNGSGKTTLFECLGGVCPADGGSVLQDRRTLTPNEKAALLFYLPDAIAPWPSQTVRWALDFTLGLFNGRSDLRQEVVSSLDLGAVLEQPIGTLSKGQRKRALLAIGLLMPQPLLVADEPFEGLDLRQTRDISLALRSYAGHEKRTMLLSIHQISDAARVCDRFVLLSGGRVRGEGTLSELSDLAAARAHSAEISQANNGALQEPAFNLERVFLALT